MEQPPPSDLAPMPEAAPPVPDYAAPSVPSGGSEASGGSASDLSSSWSNFKVNAETTGSQSPLLGARGSVGAMEPTPPAPSALTGTKVSKVKSGDPITALSPAERSLRAYRASTLLGATSFLAGAPTTFETMQRAFGSQLETLLDQIEEGEVVLCSSGAELDTSAYFPGQQDVELEPLPSARLAHASPATARLAAQTAARQEEASSPSQSRHGDSGRESRFTLRRRAKQLLVGPSRPSSVSDLSASGSSLRSSSSSVGGQEDGQPSGSSELAGVYKVVVRTKKAIIDYARKRTDLPYVMGHPVRGGAMEEKGMRDSDREEEVYRCLDAFLSALEAKTGLPGDRIRTLIGSVQFDELQQQVVHLVNQKQKVKLMYTQVSQELAALQSSLEHVEEQIREDERKYSKTQAIRTDTAKQDVRAQAKDLSNTREIAFLWEVQLDKMFEDCSVKMHKIYSEFLEVHRMAASEPAGSPPVSDPTSPRSLSVSLSQGLGLDQGGGMVPVQMDMAKAAAAPVADSFGDPHLRFFLKKNGFEAHLTLLNNKRISFSQFSCMADMDLAELGIKPAADCLALHSAILSINDGPNGTKVVKEGWMMKRGELVKNWKRRYFKLLSSNDLLYFKDQACVRQCGLLDLNRPCTVSKHVVDNEKLQHCFRVTTAARTWIFSCGNASGRSDWVQLLNGIVNYNRMRATAAT